MGDRTIRDVRKIRYTEDEWDTIVERAHACGQPPGRYVRDVSLGVVPKGTRVQANASVVHELGRIGNALMTLCAQTRSNGDVERAESIDGALQDLLNVVRRLA